MSFRVLISVLCFGAAGSLIPSLSTAKVPYREIESLRRTTVALRVAIDAPKAASVKKCKLKLNPVDLGQKLAQAQDRASQTWGQLTVSTEDLHDLDSKFQACGPRGSCQIYDLFLKSAKTEPSIQQEVEVLKDVLDKKLQTLTTKNYLKAFRGMPKACDVLRQAMK
jgi:hypothetical protein